MITVTTESGTKYELTDDLASVKREGGDALRRDGDWLACGVLSDGPTVGEPLVFALEPLGDTPITIRTTTQVVSIERSAS